MLPFADFFQSPVSGLFTLKVYQCGRLIEEYEDHNLIVDTSRQVHARLLGGDVANRSVTKIGFGTNGTAPMVGNTTLTAAFVKAIDTVAYPATNQVQFNFSLGTSEANGTNIFEFGLLTAGDTLYARKVRSAFLSKDSDISLTGAWIIHF